MDIEQKLREIIEIHLPIYFEFVTTIAFIFFKFK